MMIAAIGTSTCGEQKKVQISQLAQQSDNDPLQVERKWPAVGSIRGHPSRPLEAKTVKSVRYHARKEWKIATREKYRDREREASERPNTCPSR